MSFLFRRKLLELVNVHEAERRLLPTLSWPHMVALGVGAIVGTGVYALIGVGAHLAGPAVLLLSFAVAGAVCACASPAARASSVCRWHGCSHRWRSAAACTCSGACRTPRRSGSRCGTRSAWSPTCGHHSLLRREATQQ